MDKLFSRLNQSVTEYVNALDLELPDDLAALNPGLDLAPQPAPEVEVHEVNDDAVWELWQDSVAFQDSQFGDSLADECPMQAAPAPPEVLASFVDAFASAHGKPK